MQSIATGVSCTRACNFSKVDTRHRSIRHSCIALLSRGVLIGSESIGTKALYGISSVSAVPKIRYPMIAAPAFAKLTHKHDSYR